jgi:hypothetical protein
LLLAELVDHGPLLGRSDHDRLYPLGRFVGLAKQLLEALLDDAFDLATFSLIDLSETLLIYFVTFSSAKRSSLCACVGVSHRLLRNQKSPAILK